MEAMDPRIAGATSLVDACFRHPVSSGAEESGYGGFESYLIKLMDDYGFVFQTLKAHRTTPFPPEREVPPCPKDSD